MVGGTVVVVLELLEVVGPAVVVTPDAVVCPTEVVGAMVVVEGHNLRATTDAEGRFRLDGLSPGRYTLAVQAGELTLRCEVKTRDPGYTMTLRWGGARPPESA